MCRKHCDRLELTRAIAGFAATVTAVLGSEHQPVARRIVITFRPAVIAAGLQI